MDDMKLGDFKQQINQDLIQNVRKRTLPSMSFQTGFAFGLYVSDNAGRL